MAGKQFDVLVPFHREDLKTGKIAYYEAGKTYSDDGLGPVPDDPNHGPLIREKNADSGTKEN